MPDNVYSAAMTLDGSQYLATNVRLEAATAQITAAIARMSLVMVQLANALKPAAVQGAAVQKQFEAIRASSLGVASASAPATEGLSATARAMAGLADDSSARGLRQMEAVLSSITEQADAAGLALQGVSDDAESAGGAIENEEGPGSGGSEKQGEGGGNHTAAATAVGVAAGNRESVAGAKQLADEDRKLEKEVEHLDSTMAALAKTSEHTADSTHHATAVNKEAETQAHHTAAALKEEASGFRGLGEGVTKVAEVLRDISLAVPELALLVGVFAGIDEAIEKVRENFEGGDKLNALSRQTGETAESLAKLQRTFEYFDVDGNAVGTTLFMLQRALGGVSEGGEPTAAAFARIGLSISELKKQDAATQFAEIQKGLQTLPDQATRASVAMKIFGRSALDVQSILNASPADFAESMSAAEDYASVMGKNADMFEEVERKFFVFRENIETLFARIAVGLAPAVDALLSAVNKVDFSKWGKDITLAFALITMGFSSGDFTAAVFLSIDAGAVKATQYMVGYFIAAAQALSAALAAIFTADFWSGLKSRFIGVAEAFGAALLRVLSGPIAEMQAALDYVINKRQAGADYQADKKDYESDSALVDRKQQEFDVWSKMSTQGMGPHEKAAYDKKLAEAKSALVGAHKFAGQDASRMSKDADIQGMSMEDYVAKNGNQPTLFGQNVDKLNASSQSNLGNASQALTPIGQAIAKAAADGFNKVNAPGNILSDALARINAQRDAINARYTGTTEDGTPRAGSSALPAHDALDYKLPQGDRLSRVGLFVGGSTATPGLTEAKRTAAATERTARSVDQLVASVSTRRGGSTTFYQ